MTASHPEPTPGAGSSVTFYPLGPCASASQSPREKRQALVHPIIDRGMVVGELLVPMGNAKLVQPPHEPAGSVEQVELILLAAVNVQRLQPTEIARLGVDRDDRVLPQPIRPAFLDNLAGAERDRQADPQELRGIGIVFALITALCFFRVRFISCS
jgi:hypothetical protein